jgi:hypothetical protein
MALDRAADSIVVLVVQIAGSAKTRVVVVAIPVNTSRFLAKFSAATASAI